VDLSEQQLLDCTWETPGVKHGNNGCLGGWTWKAFAWIHKFGIATAKSYGHYRGQVSLLCYSSWVVIVDL